MSLRGTCAAVAIYTCPIVYSNSLRVERRMKTIIESEQPISYLCLNEALNILQPSDVLLLLLHVNIVWHKDC